MNKISDKLVILSPSKINNKTRFAYAEKSFCSLNGFISNLSVKHIITHDSPAFLSRMPKLLNKLIPASKWDAKAKKLYRKNNVSLIKGNNSGSAGALLAAVNQAICEGKKYGFIHLDDHIYCDPIVELLINGTREMEQNPDLLWTRFSGYPLIYDGRGNLSKKNDRITFDSVVLNSLKRETYTLWFSNLQSDVNKGRYWPVAMWFSIFRLPILRKILILSLKNNCKHLGNVEDYFKNKNGFKWLSLTYPEGSFGYINMQFGGFEMHRNHNWKTLIDLDNNKIL